MRHAGIKHIACSGAKTLPATIAYVYGHNHLAPSLWLLKVCTCPMVHTQSLTLHQCTAYMTKLSAVGCCCEETLPYNFTSTYWCAHSPVHATVLAYAAVACRCRGASAAATKRVPLCFAHESERVKQSRQRMQTSRHFNVEHQMQKVMANGRHTTTPWTKLLTSVGSRNYCWTVSGTWTDTSTWLHQSLDVYVMSINYTWVAVTVLQPQNVIVQVIT